SGPEVYIERQFPTTNTNGLASIEIGNGTVVNGDFIAIDWANGPYFIKTEIDLNGGSSYTITGTSQLLSVPYALYAMNTGNAWGFNGNSGTNDSVSFIGTTDNQDIVFKRNNIEAGRLNDDLNNTSFGVNTLSSLITGDGNTAIGNSSLALNTTGFFNSSLGFQALFLNTTGHNNVACGTF